jgi:hypothetical protein
VGGVEGAQDAEDVGFKLAADIIERKSRQAALHPEAGVGDHHVEDAERLLGLFGSALEVAVPGYVPCTHQDLAATCPQLARQGDKAVGAACDQDQAGTTLGELSGQGSTDATRCAGNHHGKGLHGATNVHGS